MERRNRMRVALWAYAYEVECDSLVDDHVFDKLCLEIDLSIDTDRPDLDKWFRENFDPSTGMWVRSHPEIDKLKKNYRLLRNLVKYRNDT